MRSWLGADGRLADQSIGRYPFGHKISIRDIHSSDSIVKYGEVIGTASRDIPAGSHVHVQNVESNRGRGDMAEQNTPASQLESCEEVFTPKVPDRPIINARSLCYRGYSRPDGSVGIRNLVGIILCVACAKRCRCSALRHRRCRVLYSSARLLSNKAGPCADRQSSNQSS